MRIEVVFASTGTTWSVNQVEVSEGATVIDAVRASGLLDRHPMVDSESGHAFAIFGRAVRPTTVLDAGDRVEVLRPLTIDPKEARRLRAERKARLRRAG